MYIVHTISVQSCDFMEECGSEARIFTTTSSNTERRKV